MRRLHERWMHFWFEPAEPTNLGICRILFFGSLFLFYLPLDVSDWAGVSHAFWMPIQLFYRFQLPVLSCSMLTMLQAFWKIMLVLSCIGLFTRVTTAGSFFVGIYLLGLPHNFGKVHHNDAIVVIVLGIMALSRCGDSWSVDQIVGKARRGDISWTERPMSGEYTWPVRMVWLVLALVFFAAGISKIRYSGLEWIFSDSLANMLIESHYHANNADPLTSWGLYLAQYSWLCRLLAAATIIIEVGYPLALFSWRARWILVPAAFFMLIGIYVVMGPTFVQFLFCNLFWIPWDRVYRIPPANWLAF